MKFRKLFIYSALILLIASCKKDTKMPGTGGTTPPSSYVITEAFESGSKNSYAAADVTLSTGSWNFNNALICNLAGDVKDGNWAVRLKTGDIAMNFDINGLSQVSIKHAKYGADGSSTWQFKM